jgi:hypothetical protein
MNYGIYTLKDFLDGKIDILSLNRSEICDFAYSFRQQKALIFTNLLFLLLSLLTLLFIYLVYINREFRRIFSLIELDLKIIVLTGALSYLISSISSSLFYGVYFIILLMDLPPCTYIINGTNCMWAQSPFASICTIASLLFFFAMFLERAAASIGLNGRGFFGGILSLLIVIVSPLPQLLVFDKKMYSDDR